MLPWPPVPISVFPSHSRRVAWSPSYKPRCADGPPRRQNEGAGLSSIHRSPTVRKVATRRVILAEDNEKLRRLMAKYLRTVGYTVDEANNGIEALEMMRASVPDAILLDMQMPDMDGPTLLATYRRDPRLAVVPVVVLSGQPTDEATANEIGARAYLMKPVDLDVLRSVLDRVTRA